MSDKALLVVISEMLRKQDQQAEILNVHTEILKQTNESLNNFVEISIQEFDLNRKQYQHQFKINEEQRKFNGQLLDRLDSQQKFNDQFLDKLNNQQKFNHQFIDKLDNQQGFYNQFIDRLDKLNGNFSKNQDQQNHFNGRFLN